MKKLLTNFALLLCLVIFFQSCSKNENLKNNDVPKKLNAKISRISILDTTLSEIVGNERVTDLLYLDEKSDGRFDIKISKATEAHHITKWELYKDNSFWPISSSDVDIYQNSDPKKSGEVILASLQLLGHGAYRIKVYFDATYGGPVVGWVYGPGVGITTTSIIQTDPIFSDGTINIYRYFNQPLGDHFYSTVKTDFPGYVAEGIAFKAFPKQSSSGVPMYRYWNAGIADHFYTLSSTAPTPWIPEGIRFRVLGNQQLGWTPLLRYWNSSAGDHFYTATSGSYPGFVYEGVEGYVKP